MRELVTTHKIKIGLWIKLKLDCAKLKLDCEKLKLDCGPLRPSYFWPRSRLNILLNLTFESEAKRVNLQGNQRILKWRPFWNKVYCCSCKRFNLYQADVFFFWISDFLNHFANYFKSFDVTDESKQVPILFTWKCLLNGGFPPWTGLFWLRNPRTKNSQSERTGCGYCMIALKGN